MGLGRKPRGIEPTDFLGGAHFATPEEITAGGLACRKGNPALGYYGEPGKGKPKDWGQVVRYAGDSHLITVAPARSGKIPGRALRRAPLEYPGLLHRDRPQGAKRRLSPGHTGQSRSPRAAWGKGSSS